MSSTPVVATPRSVSNMQPFFREAAVNRETSLALLDGLDAAHLGWRPAAAVWGLSDICEHLRIITALYLPALDTAIDHGHAVAAYSDQPFSGNVVSRLLVWSMEPPVRLRIRTPGKLRPLPTVDPIAARNGYAAMQRALELRLERSAGLDLAHVSVRSPTMRGMQLALGTVFAIILAHERRHLWQATAVRQHAQFPS